jgi:hypothetical protein
MTRDGKRFSDDMLLEMNKTLRNIHGTVQRMDARLEMLEELPQRIGKLEEINNTLRYRVATISATIAGAVLAAFEGVRSFFTN